MSTSLLDRTSGAFSTALDTIAATAGVPIWAVPATAAAVAVAGTAGYRLARTGRAARSSRAGRTSDASTSQTSEAVEVDQAARAVRADRVLRRVETSGTIVAALLATAVSASGMWNFFEHVLGVTGPARVLMFAFLEIALGVSAIRARRRIREVIDLMRAHHAGTWTGPIPSGRSVHQVLVWAVVVLSGVMSAADTEQWSGKLLRLAAPAVAAVLWEIGDLAELQAARIRYGITPEPLAWRYSLRRLLVLARLADPTTVTGAGGADGVQMLAAADRSRRLTALVRARYRLEATGAKAPRALHAWRAWRVRRLTIAAVERAGLGVSDPTAVHHVQHGLALLYTVQTGTAPAAVAHLDPWNTHHPETGPVSAPTRPSALTGPGVLAVPAPPLDPDASADAAHRADADPRPARVLAPAPVATGPVPGPVVRGAAVAARPSHPSALTATVHPTTPETDSQILANLADTPAEALPSIRALMRTHGIGQNRATRIHRAATDRATDRATAIPNARNQHNSKNHNTDDENTSNNDETEPDENQKITEENTTIKINHGVTTDQHQLI